jgi:uncharacterized membrane protein YedE/YeeE
MNGPLYYTGILGEGASFVAAFLIGISFGFVLERAGFASVRRLTDIFYFRDFAVLRVMFTAIVTAALGLLFFEAMGLIDPRGINFLPTNLWPQIIGGLVFGVGFVAGGYCPGTAAVAAACGRKDAWAFLAGMLAGIFGFIVGYGPFEGFMKGSAMGEVSLPAFFRVSPGLIALGVVIMALGAFALTEWVDSLKKKTAG